MNESQITILTREVGINIANNKFTTQVLNKFRKKYITLIERNNILESKITCQQQLKQDNDSLLRKSFNGKNTDYKVSSL